MHTADKCADKFRSRLQDLANEERRGWHHNKETARRSLARRLGVSERQLERWLSPNGIKEPKASVWLRVEDMWLALKALHDATCERLEASAKKNNSESSETGQGTICGS